MVMEGSAFDAIESYRGELDTVEEATVQRPAGAIPAATITRVRVRNERGVTPRLHQPTEPLVFELHAVVEPELRQSEFVVDFGVETEAGMRIFTVVSSWEDELVITAPDGTLHVRCVVPQLPLAPGRYFVSAWLGQSNLIEGDQLLHSVLRADTFEIAPGGVLLHPPRESSHGPVAVDFKFEVDSVRSGDVGHAPLSSHRP
jgi:hypothetical protein